MRIIAVFKENSEQARNVLEWIEQFERRTGKEVEQIDPETLEGEMFVRARDIVEYPTIMVCSDEDGKTYEMFVGSALPQIDTVMAYVI